MNKASFTVGETDLLIHAVWTARMKTIQDIECATDEGDYSRVEQMQEIECQLWALLWKILAEL